MSSPVSETIRNISNAVDLTPLAGLDDLGAAGGHLVATGIDAGGKLLSGDLRGAGRDLLTGTTQAAMAALPWVEFGNIGKFAGGSGISDAVSAGVGTLYDRILPEAQPAPSQGKPQENQQMNTLQHILNATLTVTEQAGKAGELGDWAAVGLSALGQQKWADAAQNAEAWGDVAETVAPAARDLLQGMSFGDVARHHGGGILGAATDVAVTQVARQIIDKLPVPDPLKTVIVDHISDWSQDMVRTTVNGLTQARETGTVAPSTQDQHVSAANQMLVLQSGGRE